MVGGLNTAHRQRNKHEQIWVIIHWSRKDRAVLFHMTDLWYCLYQRANMYNAFVLPDCSVSGKITFVNNDSYRIWISLITFSSVQFCALSTTLNKSTCFVSFEWREKWLDFGLFNTSSYLVGWIVRTTQIDLLSVRKLVVKSSMNGKDHINPVLKTDIQVSRWKYILSVSREIHRSGQCHT